MDQSWFPNLNYLNVDYLKSIKLSAANVIDILIIAFVFYRLLLLIKGTRAVQLLKGLAILLIATGLSSMFNLYAVNWLLKQVMAMLIVALPVVFQPELRRALEKLGRGKLFAYHLPVAGEADQAGMMDEVVRAAAVLSADKVGALIVIERETGLEEHIDTGVKIDGLVSAEFLIAAFIPNGPLHDGAAIIRGNRVVAAACFLPLSDNIHLSNELGARHRAGLGISEHSDALAVIVSEETGVVSLAVEGVLTRHLDQKTLYDRLTGFLHPRTGSSLASLWQKREHGKIDTRKSKKV